METQEATEEKGANIVSLRFEEDVSVGTNRLAYVSHFISVDFCCTSSVLL